MNNGESGGGQGGGPRPAHVVRYGRLKGTIWRNMVDVGNASGPMYNVTLTRSYRDGQAWKDSTSFGFDDLLLVAKISDDCHTWIHAQRAQDAASEE